MPAGGIFLAYTLRHRTVNLYTNYIYANLSIVLILIDVCLLIFLNTLKNVLKRGYLVEFIATIKHVAIVELVAVLYLFSVKMREIFANHVLSHGIILWIAYLWNKTSVEKTYSSHAASEAEQVRTGYHKL